MIYGLLESASKIAPLGTFCVALTAILIAFNQLKKARANEAKKQYLSYLDDCIKNDGFLKYTGQQYGENEFYINYRYFVSKMLMAFESILDEYPDDTEWYNSIYSNLQHHAPYLKARHDREKKYSGKLQSIIDEVIEKTPVSPSRVNEPMTKEQLDRIMASWEAKRKPKNIFEAVAKKLSRLKA